MGNKKEPSYASQLRRSGYEGRKATEDKEKKSSYAKASEDKGKGLKVECCEKYLKKGEHKRCKRCPCFDMSDTGRLNRFKNLEIKIDSQV